ncbi:hypothetical protein GQ602_001118 [Ophiocordyceps camponoti-floridani]|uniref:Uncharacterized protein n=1 Tax=Ophiocordyceps camponoti-floridani TaxID=2030778 RepID=A0A8H4QDE8_9HYPO|nr:hypothetical protein GQ602_001118 [Ophiocordyceps camponoti-floridani]
MPDLNSVPPSPRSLHRRRSSQHAAMASLNILPSNQTAVVGQQPQQQSSPDAGVGPGPGPLRHPRPLTASELHMQLEKEQEAVVNRLTRELSLLRAAQNASVVSNASSTSATPSTSLDVVPDSSLMTGTSFTPRRHHRNSSATSQHIPYDARQRASVPLSRQDSTASRRSQTNSPAPHAMDPSSYFHNQRVPPPFSVYMGSVSATPASGSFPEQLSPGLMPATSRYEETAYYRTELDAAKKENEGLKRRIRELERMVQSRRAAERGRSSSDVYANRPDRGRGVTSQSVASASSVGVGVPEDEVRVGESAASAGLGNNAQ